MTKSKAKMTSGEWVDKLVGSVGQFFELETTDGLMREGKLTGLRTRSMRFDGEDVNVVTDIEINGDGFDLLPIHRIGRFDFI